MEKFFKLKENNIPAVAITDSGNMFGAKAFSKYASENGIKPILGCQFYVRNPDADDFYELSPVCVSRILTRLDTNGITTVKMHPWYFK